MVDTAAAYFEGDNDNDNVQAGNHARMLRSLVGLPGEPCVLVLCHPTKNAKTIDEMVPRGGGAFLNEVDGNLAAASSGGTIAVQTVGKFRGPELSPIHFGLHVVRNHPRLVDEDGRPMPTVVAHLVNEAGMEARAAESETADIALVRYVDNNPGVALEKIATAFGTNKSAANRMVERLIKENLLKRDRLTKKLTVSPTAQKSLNELENDAKRSETPLMPFPGVPGPRTT
ncbi:helix-turn-helix domain-containing protein [Bradyrhizobium sp. OK095]|uniref:MarR family transcriptional regulator n=1 Tax=Bradyrhizobium sp. OK095 TaxID=1882760 RepID=UPI00116008DB|nr:helix-turn-helix domain-containing protein [Bradyrhizobium sp. OK095]